MTMEITFKAGGDFVIVRIIHRNLYFAKQVAGIPSWFPIEKINLPVQGILDKFPDLNGMSYSEVKKEGARRLMEHIKTMNTELEIKEYVIKELESIGCIPMMVTRPGFRPEIIRRGADAH